MSATAPIETACAAIATTHSIATTTTTSIATTTTTTTTTTATRRLGRQSELRSPASSFQTQVQMALHQQLLSASERRRNNNLKPAFHDVAHHEDGAPKSMKIFKGEAKDMLTGIFTVLLLRFLLALAVVVGAIGALGLLVLVLQHTDVPVLGYVRQVFD